ncbi:hypothetical protein GETHLI_06460 [Geothrix limicola]|uniref:SH3 domain-containing protein n=1 Tax=Geothrix limicola TaxID=2927978 RepID=A0ABQ5QBE2_9BACT|nr:hypothetical protein [Geothrix limicola]GLH72144.1 hypothetical protein GETHLI_06460 [Geothrix limicola]
MDEWREWIRDRSSLLIMLALTFLGGAWWWHGRAVTHPAGVLVAAEPIQTEPDPAEPWTFKQHRITPLAHFEIRARVLSTERYRFDRASELSPVDFALGWGPMSDSRVLEAFSIHQRDRWYFWSTEVPVIPSVIISHSANMHLIPATDSVARRLLSVKTGQLVELRGQLVRVDGPDGWHWVSSLSRTDTGDGSCEVIWVESARAADR